MKCKDHLGNEFCSVELMCKHWGVNYGTFAKRVRLGWSKEKALTVPLERSPRGGRSKGKSCRDYLGNEFDSFKMMCEHYGVGISIVRKRLKSGWSLKKALTTPSHRKILKVILETKDEHCKTYYEVYYTINNGGILEKALKEISTIAYARTNTEKEFIKSTGLSKEVYNKLLSYANKNPDFGCYKEYLEVEYGFECVEIPCPHCDFIIDDGLGVLQSFY